jgi:hypothetical protein
MSAGQKWYAVRFAQVGHLIDMHAYVGPNAPLPTPTRAAVLGEFGGLGLRLDSHLWIPEDSFYYEMMPSSATLEVRPILIVNFFPLFALRFMVGTAMNGGGP